LSGGRFEAGEEEGTERMEWKGKGTWRARKGDGGRARGRRKRKEEFCSPTKRKVDA